MTKQTSDQHPEAQDISATTESAEAPTADSQAQPEDTKKKDPVRIWSFVVLSLVLVLMGWYLVSDRLTPYSTQARVHALIVPVAPLISGQVEEVLVTNNQAVSEGDVLFTINIDTYQLQLKAAEADLQSARQSVGASTANVAAAAASVTAAKASLKQAEQDVDRLRSIRAEDPGAISERRLQASEAGLVAAGASVDAANASLEKARQDLGVEGDNNVRILQAGVAIANAQLNIDRATVRAPGDGIVIDVRLDTGNYAGAGTPQMTFVSTDDVWIQVDYTENNLGRIKPGDAAELIFDVQPGEVFSGTVRGTGFGVQIDTAPLGGLPTIENDKNWLRDAQRFPVLVDFDSGHIEQLHIRVGSQGSVIVYTGDHPIMNTLARLRIRLATYLSYAY